MALELGSLSNVYGGRLARWHGDSAAFVDWLLNTAGVALMPGICFGQAGEGWVRISLLKHTAELFQAVARADRALRSA